MKISMPLVFWQFKLIQMFLKFDHNGGTAILYRKFLNPFMKLVKTYNARVTAATLDCTYNEQPMTALLASVYMPTLINTGTDDDVEFEFVCGLLNAVILQCDHLYCRW